MHTHKILIDVLGAALDFLLADVLPLVDYLLQDGVHC
jgi:hypothetical protein